MVSLDPEAAARVACERRGHLPVSEPSEPEVGFRGQTWCEECGVILAVDVRYGERKRRA